MKIRSIKHNKRVKRRIFRIVILIALCFVCFIFAVSYIKYQQCLNQNRKLKSIYADLLMKIKEIEESNNAIKGVEDIK